MREYVRHMAKRAVPSFNAGRGEQRPHMSFEEQMVAGFVPDQIEVR